MGLAKNGYIELNEKEELFLKQAEPRNISQLHDVFRGMKGFKFISNRMVQLEINGKLKKVGIFRITPEGDEAKDKKESVQNKKLHIKRVQIKNSDLPELPEEIIAVYICEGQVIFCRLNSLSPAIDLPSTGNPTTLFRIDIRVLKESLKNEVSMYKVVSRNKKNSIIRNGKKKREDVEVFISKSFEKLFEKKSQDNAFEIKEQDVESVKIDISEFDDLSGDDDAPILQQEEEKKLDDMLNKKIGEAAEKIVFNELVSRKGKIFEIVSKMIPEYQEVKWMNEFGEQFNPYDFIVDGRIIEVKGSMNAGSFIYTYREDEKRIEQGENYFLIKLNNVNFADEIYGDAKIYSCTEIEEMVKRPIHFLVEEMER